MDATQELPLEALMLPGDFPEWNLAALFHRPPWMRQAACRGENTSDFFPEKGQPLEPARAVCRGCPVRQQCADYATGAVEMGVWGGLSDAERRSRRRSAA